MTDLFGLRANYFPAWLATTGLYSLFEGCRIHWVPYEDSYHAVINVELDEIVETLADKNKWVLPDWKKYFHDLWSQFPQLKKMDKRKNVSVSSYNHERRQAYQLLRNYQPELAAGMGSDFVVRLREDDEQRISTSSFLFFTRGRAYSESLEGNFKFFDPDNIRHCLTNAAWEFSDKGNSGGYYRIGQCESSENVPFITNLCLRSLELFPCGIARNRRTRTPLWQGDFLYCPVWTRPRTKDEFCYLAWHSGYADFVDNSEAWRQMMGVDWVYTYRKQWKQNGKYSEPYLVRHTLTKGSNRES